MKEKLGFIGAGTVGTAFAVKLSEGGYPVIAVADSNQAAAKRLASMIPGCQVYDMNQGVVDAAEFIFITTQDEFIPKIIDELSWHPNKNVVHCSGIHSLDILEPAKRAGARVGSFHPVQTFASLDQAIKNLPGSTFGLQGEPPLLDTLKEMVATLQGNWLELKPADKPFYHISTVFASNYVVALMKIATDMWHEFGKSTEEATKALMPILQGTVNNISNIGFPNCISGPIARGDVSIIRKHLATLKEDEPGLVSIYKQLGLHDVPLALAKGTISEKIAEELQSLLQED